MPVVSQKAVLNGVPGPFLELMLTTRNVAHVLMQKSCHGRLKGALKNSGSQTGSNSTPVPCEPAAPLRRGAGGLVEHQSRKERTEIRARRRVVHLEVDLHPFASGKRLVVGFGSRYDPSDGVDPERLVLACSWGRILRAGRRRLAGGAPGRRLGCSAGLGGLVV